MNLAQVGRILAGFVLFFSLVQACLLAVAAGETDVDPRFDPRAGFAWGAGAGIAIAAALWLGGRKAAPEFYRREGLAVVGLAWLIAGALGGVPFWASGAFAAPTDAFFESVSGLTTTGASVCGSGGNPTIEELPRSILLWRSLLQWIGGIGVIFVFIVLLPAMGVTGKNLLQSEQIGVADENLRPSMRQQARSLFRLYVGMTVVLAAFLWIHGSLTDGHTGFDAICQAFTTVSTGGFSTRNLSVGAFDSVTVEVVTIVFMFFAGANFALLLRAITGRAPTTLLGNPEFRLYALVVGILIVAVTLVLWTSAGTIADEATRDRSYDDLGTCVRDASFQVVSIITSTGYCSANFQNWPHAAVVLLLFAMFVGGCTGSTAGGYKILRLLVGTKLMAFTVRRFIRPKSVEKLKIDDDVVPNSVVSSILALALMWVTSILIGTIVLSFEDRLGFLAALSTSTSMIGCVGPAFSDVVAAGAGQFAIAADGLDVGPYGGFGGLGGFSKVFLALQMILGRLEILAPLVLLAPAIWRR